MGRRALVLAVAVLVGACGRDLDDAERWAKREGFVTQTGGFAGFLEVQGARQVGASTLRYYVLTQRVHVFDGPRDYRVDWVVPRVDVQAGADASAARAEFVTLVEHLLNDARGDELCAAARDRLLDPRRFGSGERVLNPCRGLYAISMHRGADGGYSLSAFIAGRARPTADPPPELLY